MISIREAYATAARSPVIPQADSTRKIEATEEAEKPSTPGSKITNHAKQPVAPEDVKDAPRSAILDERTKGQIGLVERPSRWAVPSMSLPPVKGHSVQSNKQAADLFKALLEDDDDETKSSIAPATPQARKEELPPLASPLSVQRPTLSPFTASRGSQALLEAFENAYWPVDRGSLKRNTFDRDDGDAIERQSQDLSHLLHQGQDVSGSKMNSEEARLNAQNALHAKLSGQSVAEALGAGTVKLKKRKKLSGAPVALVLPGLGEGRTRSEYGKSLSGSSMETGVGVIGHIAPSTRATPVPEPAARPDDISPAEREETPLSCDLPMARGGGASNRIISLGGEGTRYQVGTYIIDLSPDLPALAAEHPARVWNQMLHSLSPKLQPIVKWDYQPCEPEGLQIACLTLVLPPTHPAVAHHPLFSILPANRYTREYMASVEALGGIKQWIGEPRKYKADAQNTTLVRCIAEDALAWVLDPVLEVPPDEEEEVSGELPSGLNDDCAGTNTPAHFEAGSAHADAVDDSLSTGRPGELPYKGLAPSQSLGSVFQGDRSQTRVSPGPGDEVSANPGIDQSALEVMTSYNNGTQFDEAADGEASAEYQDPGEHRHPAKSLSPPQGGLQVSTPPTIQERVTLLPEVLLKIAGPPAQVVGDIDWQAQLKHFCEVSGLPQPKYGQQVQKRPGGTKFLGTLDLEDEHFVSTVSRSLLKVARQDVARLVFVDYFGQEPSTLV